MRLGVQRSRRRPSPSGPSGMREAGGGRREAPQKQQKAREQKVRLVPPPPTSRLPPPVPSSRAGHLDASSDDLLPQLLDSCVRAVGNERAIAVVVDVADAALLDAGGIDHELEGGVLVPLDSVIGD